MQERNEETDENGNRPFTRIGDQKEFFLGIAERESMCVLEKER